MINSIESSCPAKIGTDKLDGRVKVKVENETVLSEEKIQIPSCFSSDRSMHPFHKDE